MDKLINGVKNFAGKIKNLVTTIKNVAKFFASAIGQIVFWILLAIICVIIVYIIANSISVAIKKLIRNRRWWYKEHGGLCSITTISK